MDESKPKVVILGGGFGGLSAARELRDAPVSVTLVDRRNHHPFQPLLYQVATASLNASDIAEPIRKVLADQPNTRVLLAETGPLATSSANTSGRPTPDAVQEIQGVFGDAVAVYLDGGPARAGPPSTVVRLTGPEPVLLREGAVPFTEVLQVLDG